MSAEPRTQSAFTEIDFTDWQVRIGALLDGEISVSAASNMNAEIDFTD